MKASTKHSQFAIRNSQLFRGFTLIELLMAISVIAVLGTIVTTAAVSSLHSSRERRTEAMRVSLEAAIATYHAQDTNEKWPGAIESMADGAKSGVLTESQAQDVFAEIVRKSIGASGLKNPLIDANALFVAPKGVQDGKVYGLNFREALKGGPHRSKIGVSNMAFGYQGKSSGKFRRFNIIYNAAADSVKVSTCCHECCGVNGCTKNGSRGQQACSCHTDN